jgi:hypothetical protein
VQTALCEFNPAKHQEDVFRMLEEHAMNVAGIHLTYERRPEFNKLLQLQGPAAVSILGTEKEKITGIFSISIAYKYIRGQKKWAAYIGDFRTNGTRRAASLWRKVYAEILKSLPLTDRLLKPEYFLTAILADNQTAIHNLAEPKKDLGFYYHFLRSVDMVNIFGRYPLSIRAKAHSARFATSQEEERIRVFLDESERRKAFGAVFDTSTNSEWLRRKKTWPGFKIENFVVVEDPSKNIQAISLPWSPSLAKRMRVTQAPWALRSLFKVLKVLGYNMPKVGESIETCYLTHLNIAENTNASVVVEAMISFLAAEGFFRKNHMLSFANWWGISLPAYITQQIPVNLYAVTTRKDQNLSELKTSEIGFEMGLV